MSLIQHILPYNLWKYDKNEVNFWTNVQNKKMKGMAPDDFHFFQIFKAVKLLQRVLVDYLVNILNFLSLNFTKAEPNNLNISPKLYGNDF